MRSYLIFISGSAGVIGMAFIENPVPFRMWMAFIPFLFSYGFGQALTDCFQMDTDRISSAYRPLIKGTISKQQVLGVSLAGLVLGIAILAYLNPRILLMGFLAVVGLISYTPLKKKWWGGPPWNSWIVALLPFMGRLVDREFELRQIFSRHSSPYPFLFAVGAVFFAYMNFVVMGYFKDISADRETGYRTFPVVFGWLPAAIYSDLTALLAASFTAMAILSIDIPRTIGFVFYAAAVLVNIWAQVRIHQIRDESQAHGPIVNVVRAFILYSAAIILALKGHWIVFALLFYSGFELALRFRPEKAQV
jgi:4-hydroxybenzoate polyprenyltransferase